MFTFVDLEHEHDELSIYCKPFVFVRHFAMMASLGWFFVLSLNYFLSVQNPFVRPDSRSRYYHVWVWTTAVVTAAVSADDSSYRPHFHLCYTTYTNGLNLRNWLTILAWLLVYWALSVYILWYCRSTLADSSYSRTVSSRARMNQFSAVNVATFTLVCCLRVRPWPEPVYSSGL